MSSKVYFLNDRAGSLSDAIQYKAVKVLRDAGLEQLIQKGDKVAIKVHMGEWGNSHSTRPHWYGAIVDEVKRLGAEPFIVETSTAVYGEIITRANAEDHRRSSVRRGFTEETMGCPIVFCDGDWGVDDVKTEVKNGVYLKYAYMGKKFLEFDKVIVASHFKGHIMGVFGGAMKNVGIGMASARGKYAIHNITHPKLGIKSWQFNQEVIAQLAQAPHPNTVDRMVENCPYSAFSYEDGVMSRDNDKCQQCGYCFAYMFNGAYIIPQDLIPTWPAALVDAACGFIDAIGREKMIFVNFAMDVVPGCDCMSFSDKQMVPNLGVFASTDPVAVDMACIEMAESQVAVPGSVAEEYGFGHPNTERFTNCSSLAKISQWAQLNAGAYNGMGNTEYTLVRSKVVPSEDFQLPPYTTDNPYTKVHKDVYAKLSMDPGDYFYEDANLSLPEQFTKPRGKVGEEEL